MSQRSALIVALLLLGFARARAQGDAVETVVVTGDQAHLIQIQPDDTAIGIAKPLLETPRAVTAVSDTTLDRYGVTGVDTLSDITPSAYTASYYGVEGAVNLRGTLAESYFRGFKRVENRGTYSTPLGDAAEIEILAGPPSPVYGAGKVGGLVNFVPKSESATSDKMDGEVTATYGSYSKRNMTGQLGLPADLAFASGGVRVYGEIDDSFSYYHGIHPSHQLLELSADFTSGPWALSADYMYYHSNGDVQTPGYNRLTQALIDGGTYITGSNTTLAVSPGATSLTLNNFGGNPYTFSPSFTPLYIAYPGCGSCTDAAHTLNSGYGTNIISRRTIYIDPGVDFSNTVTHTGFGELARGVGNGVLHLQAFVDTLENDRFVSYGFPGSYRTQIAETRLRYDISADAFDGRITSQSVAGVSYRYVHAVGKESYNSGVIALDRRDITQPALPNEIIASPFTPVTAGQQALGWENDVQSNTNDAGLFATSDIAWEHGLDLTLGGRYDAYKVSSVDLGVLPFEPENGKGAKGSLTYSASLSYKTPFGLVPYITNAKSSDIEIGQASQVMTSLLAADDWLSTSFLDEAGVKFAFLDNHLVGALDWYRQERTLLQQSLGSVSVLGTRSKGEEAQIRAVLNQNISLTLAASMQHTMIKGPDTSLQYIPARAAGVSPQQGFGGAYLTFNFSNIVPGNYQDTLVPHAVISPYLTYTSDDGNWGASVGGSYVTHTAQTVPDPIIFPAYALLNLSSFLRYGDWEGDVNVDNVTNARYFTPDADTYSNLGALPGIGRTWRITFKREF